MASLSHVRSLGRWCAISAIVACSGGNDGNDTAASEAELGHHPHDAGSPTTTTPPAGAVLPSVKTVFLIVLENHAWSQIKGNASAPYINGTLLTAGAHAEQYFNPPGLHPSEPNYIWLEAGANLGIKTDKDPSATNSIPASNDHLVAQLERVGKSWRSYQEDMPSGCPVASSGLYAAKHNPMVFFQDVSGSPPSTSSASCIANVRPLSDLDGDLAADHDADYNLITPNLCHDMHGAPGCPADLVKAGDDFLATWIPKIMASEAYHDNGAIFVTWDESEHGDFPIGMIVLSPLARPGAASNVKYTHSSTLRTVEELFNLPLLRDAAKATDLGALFVSTNVGGIGGTDAGGSHGGPTPDGHVLPDPTKTPGAVQTTDVATLCQTGYTRTVRSVNAQEKAQVASAYGFTGPSSAVEYDHLVSLELGGSNDPKNLWPEPISDAHVKDGLENYLHAQVCSGAMSLPDVQARIAADWVKLWHDVGQP